MEGRIKKPVRFSPPSQMYAGIREFHLIIETEILPPHHPALPTQSQPGQEEERRILKTGGGGMWEMHPGCLGDRRRYLGNVIQIWNIWNKSLLVMSDVLLSHFAIDWEPPAGGAVTQLSIINSKWNDIVLVLLENFSYLPQNWKSEEFWQEQ